MFSVDNRSRKSGILNVLSINQIIVQLISFTISSFYQYVFTGFICSNIGINRRNVFNCTKRLFINVNACGYNEGYKNKEDRNIGYYPYFFSLKWHACFINKSNKLIMMRIINPIKSIVFTYIQRYAI